MTEKAPAHKSAPPPKKRAGGQSKPSGRGRARAQKDQGKIGPVLTGAGVALFVFLRQTMAAAHNSLHANARAKRLPALAPVCLFLFFLGCAGLTCVNALLLQKPRPRPVAILFAPKDTGKEPAARDGADPAPHYEQMPDKNSATDTAALQKSALPEKQTGTAAKAPSKPQHSVNQDALAELLKKGNGHGR